MANLIVAHDWSGTLGPIEAWSQSLKTTVGLMIHSPVPLVLLWGPDGIMLYNKAYAGFAGNRHPDLLGSKVLEGWPEAAELNSRVMRICMAGYTLEYKDLELALNRRGQLEPGWMDLFYSPVIDESGKPGGVIAVVVETTERVLAERATIAQRERLAQMFQDAPSFMCQMDGPEHVIAYTNAAYQQLIAHRDVIGKTVREALPEIAGQGFYELLDQVYSTGENYRGHAVSVTLQRMPGAAPEKRLLDFIYQPVRDASGQVTGIFTEGIDVTESEQATGAVRENAERFRFLDALGKETARSLDADDILAVTTRMVGEYLGVSFCAYADMDADQDGFTIRGDWSAPGTPSIRGHYHLSDFGKPAIEKLSVGEPFVISDIRRELAPQDAAAFDALGVCATICMPLVKEGHLTALMAIHRKDAHAWTANELALITEVAERSWAHVERVRDVAQLATSEAQFRSLAQVMLNHVWTSDPDGLLDWLNDRTYTYAGAEPGTLLGNDWISIVHPDDIDAAATHWAEALAAGVPYESEFRLRRHDGQWRWHIARAAPIRDAGGEVMRWVGTNTDIQEQKEAVAALRELNIDLERKVIERTQARGQTWQVSPDLMGALNSEGYFVTSNPAWQTMLGWSEEEVASTSIFELLHPDDLERTKVGFALTQVGQPAIQFPNRYRHKDGSYRWISWVGVPEDGMVYCSGRDITEQQEKEAQLAQTEEALRQSQKMEAVGQLTGGIAHDFNNLLQGITGALDRVQHRIAQGRLGEVERFLKAAVDSANRAAALTHRLLAFSRRQTLDPRPTDVNRLIGGMEDLIRRTMGPNVQIEVVGAAGLWPVRVDPSQLENSLLNLCINARDAMPAGGKLTIETANKWLDERAAKERELPPGQYAALCVTDTGTGMAAEVISRVFDPFFTTKPLGQGTGLGLSMIYGFVRQSGGQVRIYSEVGKGTTMCLYFPRYFGQADEDSAAINEPVERGFGETVLVIDDEPTVRMLIAEVLSENFYNIIEASDGPSAFKILEGNRRIDLMITDVGLPGGMNGRQVADAARVMRSGLKVLFITGYAENATVANGHLEPGMEILAKPFAMSTLANKVREMIER